MHSRPVTLVVAFSTLCAASSAAQQVQSFQDLALRINLGDEIRIVNAQGATTVGRVRAMRRDEIRIRVLRDRFQTSFTADEVKAITFHRPSRPAMVLILGGFGALMALPAGCGNGCGDGALLGGAVGAGLGLLASLHDARPTAVFSRRTDAVAPPADFGVPGPLDSLALRANLGDKVRVEERSGTRTTGRLLRLRGDDLTIATGGGEVHVLAAAVQRVRMRSMSMGRGALLGAVAAVVRARSARSCLDNSKCSPTLAAIGGFAVGALVGSLDPRMKAVWSSREASR